MRQNRFARPFPWHWLLILGLTGGLLYQLAPVLAPFAAGAVIAYICLPAVEKLTRLGLPRWLAVLLTFVGLILIVLGLVLILAPLLIQQGKALVALLPTLYDWLQTRLSPWLASEFGVTLILDAEHVKAFLTSHSNEAKNLAGQWLPSLADQGMALAGWLTTLALLPLVVFYLLLDWPQILARLAILIPRPWEAKVTTIAREVDKVLGEFLRGQISVMLLLAAFYSVALWVAGVRFALPIGLIAGLLVFIPYVGMLTGLLLASMVALLQFGDISALARVGAVFALGQVLEGFILTPNLVGDRIGLHPLAVIFALMAFGQLFGFVGVLLALPASAALLVGLRHLRSGYFESGLYRRKIRGSFRTRHRP